MEMDLTLVAEGLEFPEGPVAMADGSVLVAEVKGGRITRVRPDGSKAVLVDSGGAPTASPSVRTGRCGSPTMAAPFPGTSRWA